MWVGPGAMVDGAPHRALAGVAPRRGQGTDDGVRLFATKTTTKTSTDPHYAKRAPFVCTVVSNRYGAHLRSTKYRNSVRSPLHLNVFDVWISIDRTRTREHGTHIHVPVVMNPINVYRWHMMLTMYRKYIVDGDVDMKGNVNCAHFHIYDVILLHICRDCEESMQLPALALIDNKSDAAMRLATDRNPTRTLVRVMRTSTPPIDATRSRSCRHSCRNWCSWRWGCWCCTQPEYTRMFT